MAEFETTFADLGLKAPILEALTDLGYEKPSPIQAECIPHLLGGRDVLGMAQTGSGKTAAFSLPLLNNIDPELRAPQILVLAPTRELAVQVAEAMTEFSKHMRGVNVVALYGGQRYDVQLRALRNTIFSVWLAYTVVWMAYGLRLISSTLLQVGPELEEAARSTGASRGQITRHVTVPLSRYGLIGSWLLMFLIFEREYSTGVYLLSPGTETIGSMLVSLWAAGAIDIVAALSFINILLAGVLLGSSYIYTRNLCFPIALHWFWNWIQGPVLGYEVSGNKFGESMLTLHLPEANLMNGGAFGFEGSMLCTVLMILGTGVILKMFRIKDRKVCQN